MIRLENVNKYFNKGRRNEIHIINNTSLEFGENGLIAILGPSGSGKTTLLNAIGGLDKIDSGEIRINEKLITDRASHIIDEIRNLNIGYIFQDYKLMENWTVYENVEISLKLIGIKEQAEIQKRVNYVLKSVDMYKYRNRPVKMLSGGEKQRVAVARAIVKNPSIVIADEPTGNLDSSNSLEIMEIIKAISKEKLVILVTHETNLANKFASRIIEIQDGKIVKDYDNESEFRKYSYDLENVSHKGLKVKYSTVNGFFSSCINGIKKVANYSSLKKILLIGFFVSSMLIVYSICNIKGVTTIKDVDFIEADKNYLQIEGDKISVEDFIKCENLDSIDYILPSDSIVNFKMRSDDYYQTIGYTYAFKGSLISNEAISDKDIINGRMPENKYEIVLDKIIFDNIVNKEEYYTTYLAIKSQNDILYKKVFMDNMEEFTIVGFVDKGSPSIYADKDMFINLINNTNTNGVLQYMIYDTGFENKEKLKVEDYNLYLNDIVVTKGRLPENDYEVIVNEKNKHDMELNKNIEIKINDIELTVVGYYTSKVDTQAYLVNNNTVKYNLITQSVKTAKYEQNNYRINDIRLEAQNVIAMVYPKDKEKALYTLQNEYNLSVKDKYEVDKAKNIENRKQGISNTVTFAGTTIVISLVEIYLIIRTSFLSKIKEIGILRAIGVKKKDIYNMFLGEIIAITTCVSIAGVFLMTYILNMIKDMAEVKGWFIVNFETIGISIFLIYSFNIIVGLLPVFKVLRKTPAQILSRHDID